MKKVLVGFAAGIALAVVVGLIFIQVGPFYRYYTAEAFIDAYGNTRTAEQAATDRAAPNVGQALAQQARGRYSAALAKGCEPQSDVLYHMTARCPFWIQP
jgi:hypothetical protein